MRIVLWARYTSCWGGMVWDGLERGTSLLVTHIVFNAQALNVRPPRPVRRCHTHNLLLESSVTMLHNQVRHHAMAYDKGGDCGSNVMPLWAHKASSWGGMVWDGMEQGTSILVTHIVFDAQALNVRPPRPLRRCNTHKPLVE